MWPSKPRHKGLVVDIADPEFNAVATFEIFFAWCCEVIGIEQTVKGLTVGSMIFNNLDFTVKTSYFYLIDQWSVFDLDRKLTEREINLLTRIFAHIQNVNKVKEKKHG